MTNINVYSVNDYQTVSGPPGDDSFYTVGWTQNVTMIANGGTNNFTMFDGGYNVNDLMYGNGGTSSWVFDGRGYGNHFDGGAGNQGWLVAGGTYFNNNSFYDSHGGETIRMTDATSGSVVDNGNHYTNYFTNVHQFLLSDSSHAGDHNAINYFYANDAGGELVLGNLGNCDLEGGKGDDRLYGGTFVDGVFTSDKYSHATLNGGAGGNDVLVAGDGYADMTPGSGTGWKYVQCGAGHDVIHAHGEAAWVTIGNFHTSNSPGVSADLIDIRGSGLTTTDLVMNAATEYAATDGSGVFGTVIHIGNSVIYLNGVHKTSLTANDFQI